MNPLLALLICVVLAYGLGRLFSHYKMPRVVGYILAGIVLGLPSLRDRMFDVKSFDAIGFLANIGIVLLFFFAGLEISLRDVKRNLKSSINIAIFNSVILFLVGFFVSRLFGFSDLTGAIVGVALAVSAVSMSIDILEEIGLLNTRFGKKIVETGAVSDAVQIALIGIVVALIHLSTSRFGYYRLIVDIGLFIIAVLVFRFYVVPLILRIFEKEKSSSALFTAAIVITLLIAALADYLSVGSFIGALLGGVIVRQVLTTGSQKKPWEEHSISKTIHTITFGFLEPIFFLWVGMNTNLLLMVANLDFGLVLAILAIIGTFIGTFMGNWLSAGTKAESILLGWALSVKGDVELVIAEIGRKAGVLSSEVFSAIVFMTIVVSIIAPIMLRWKIMKCARRGILSEKSIEACIAPAEKSRKR